MSTLPRIVPPLPSGVCPDGYNLTPEGNCVHSSGNYGFRPTTGGSGNSNTNQRGGQYVMKSTGEPYNGPVLKTQSGEFYTTTTGAREGFNGVGPGGQLLVLASESTIQPTQQQTAVGDENPVTRLFTAPATPRYYLPNGNLVSIGARLHQHQDGTVMTEHSMGANDNSVVVTTVPPNGRARTNGITQTRGRRTRNRRAQTQTRTQQQNNMNMNRNRRTTTTQRTQTQRTQTQRNQTQRRTGGMGGGRTSGGGRSGY